MIALVASRAGAVPATACRRLQGGDDEDAFAIVVERCDDADKPAAACPAYQYTRIAAPGAVFDRPVEHAQHLGFGDTVLLEVRKTRVNVDV